MFDNCRSTNGDERVASRGHFATEITLKKILDVGYWQLIMYRNVNVNVDLVMHAKKKRIGDSKSCKASHKSSKGTIYEMGT
jgi:hypothetical protein